MMGDLLREHADTGWPLPFVDGVWNDEHDGICWRSPKGFACLVDRNWEGAWCGYVGVPEGHPAHSIPRAILARVLRAHGGISFAGSGGMRVREWIPGTWWIGFDCAHAHDGTPYRTAAVANWRPHCDQDGEEQPFGDYRPLHYAVGEVKSLALQLAAMVDGVDALNLDPNNEILGLDRKREARALRLIGRVLRETSVRMGAASGG